MKYHVSICLFLCAAATVLAASVHAPETWPDASLQGWQCFDHAVGTPSVAELDVVAGALQMVPVVDPGATLDPRWSFMVGTNASLGNFTGSFYGIGAHTLAFDFQSSIPATLTVEWINNTQFIIYKATVPIGASPVSERLSFPLDPDHFSPEFIGSDALFEALMRDTELVWITLGWDKAEPSPAFSIDNVELLGAGMGYGAWIDGFTLDLGDRLAGADVDTDGLINGDEFNIDTLPNLSNGLFRISYSSNMVEWASSINCQYAVLRSTNLVEGVFDPVDFVFGSGAAMQYQDAETNAAAFYKVEVERKP